MKKTSYKQGFTLIELLVVVLIIGVLVTVALPRYQKAVDKTHVSELFTIAKNIKTQQEVFFLANGYYAADCDELGADLPHGFEEDTSNPGSYIFQRGSYLYVLKCQNDQTRVMANVQTENFFASIEMYFDQFSDEEVKSSNKGKQGKAFCYGKYTQRDLNVCKSFGKEFQDNVYWL